MSPEDQRIAIAEACRWTDRRIQTLTPDISLGRCWISPECRFYEACPDYLNDLNAMHSALQSQTQAFRAEFDRLLHVMAEEKHLLVTELEAKDWADCFSYCLQSQRDSGNSTP